MDVFFILAFIVLAAVGALVIRFYEHHENNDEPTPAQPPAREPPADLLSRRVDFGHRSEKDGPLAKREP